MTILYSTMLMCWQAQVRCQRSRTASETFGAVGEVHPLKAWTRHQRSSRSIGEAAAATEEHDWRLLQAASEAAVDDFVRDGRFFYTLR